MINASDVNQWLVRSAVDEGRVYGEADLDQSAGSRLYILV